MSDGRNAGPTFESRFKTPEGAAKYLAAYDATLALWPVRPQPVDVVTGIGTTHINVVGSADSPPLILIHGFGVTSTQWYPNVASLSRHFRVYALDVIDQIGRSALARRLRSLQDFATWLIEVLEALKVERASIVGHSHGGWLTLNLALTAPQRVERMALLSPALSFAPMRLQLPLRMLPAFFFPTRRMFYRVFQSTTTMPLADGHPLVEQFITGIKGIKPQEIGAPLVSVFTDDELRRINVPTLLLIGEHEIIYNPETVLKRARRLLPHVETELIAGGGHLFPVDQADATNVRL